MLKGGVFAGLLDYSVGLLDFLLDFWIFCWILLDFWIICWILLDYRIICWIVGLLDSNFGLFKKCTGLLRRCGPLVHHTL
jgi:hypothetical protein